MADTAVEALNSRQYQVVSKYLLPNDDEEHDRLDDQHVALVKTMQGRLAWAPVQNPKHVLDMCTGTGVWATEYAKQNPEVQVTGIDLDEISVSGNYTPENCKFIGLQDVEAEASWSASWSLDQKYDLIHMRMVLSCFDDMKYVLRQCLNQLAPGGYLELQELLPILMSQDGSEVGTALDEIYTLNAKGVANMGRDFHKALHYKDWLAEAGFVDVVEKQMEPGLPLGPEWYSDPAHKEIGVLGKKVHSRFIGMGTNSALLKKAGLDDARILDLTARAQKELADGIIHATCPVYVVYGRKPIDGEK